MATNSPTPEPPAPTYTTHTCVVHIPPVVAEPLEPTTRSWQYWGDEAIRDAITAAQGRAGSVDARTTAQIWVQILTRFLSLTFHSNAVPPWLAQQQQRQQHRLRRYQLVSKQFTDRATQEPLGYETVELSWLPDTAQTGGGPEEEVMMMQITCYGRPLDRPELHMKHQLETRLMNMQPPGSHSVRQGKALLAMANGAEVWFQTHGWRGNAAPEDPEQYVPEGAQVLSLEADRLRVERSLRQLRYRLLRRAEESSSYLDSDSSSDGQEAPRAPLHRRRNAMTAARDMTVVWPRNLFPDTEIAREGNGSGSGEVSEEE
ncbi:uncharacterized protein BP01DRAFT_397932 [Aspergillus saccharolyticus JOP 1030-1]|uniref:Uncharacterized protein n=1 Tax=Aspergillus saccharolyticus JOP 1030-1 TaxID=1450539 RepID=A0A318ZEM4_9EURO|nr:hypothetical protein BP01DRAFT_397932 [Aspergillus saccharolyticus JOP 1030-1]PYH45996.1 hypothetical protein BP01DRAFT_397932 [Aspergillus saccharolyticus JOP 1030-1]